MKKKIISALLCLSIVLLSIFRASADSPFKDVCTSTAGGDSSTSVVCQNQNNTTNPLFGPSGVLTRVIQVLVIIAGASSVIMIIIGGIKYAISSGDANNTKSAKDTILYALIGLVIAVLAQAIVAFVLNKV